MITIYNFGRRFSTSTLRSLEDLWPDSDINEIDMRFDIDLHANIHDQIREYVEFDMPGLSADTKAFIALGGLSVGMAYLLSYLSQHQQLPWIVETIKLESLGGRYGLKGVYDSATGKIWLSTLS